MKQVLRSCVLTFIIFGLFSLFIAVAVPPLVAPKKLSCDNFDTQAQAQATFIQRPNDFAEYQADPSGRVCIDLPQTPQPSPSAEGINYEIMSLQCGPAYPVLVDWINTQIQQVSDQIIAQSLSAYLAGRVVELDCTMLIPIPGGGVNTGDGTMPTR